VTLLSQAALAFAALLVTEPSETKRPPDAFKRISPEEAGYSRAGLKKLEDFLTTSGSQSLVLVHDGRIFFEWGDIRRKLLVHSVRKALLSSLYGILYGKREVDLDKTLGQIGVDDIPPNLSDQEKTAALRDVLKSRSGVYHPAAAESEGMARGRPERGSALPGARYYYNNWDFNVAGHVLERLSGKSVYEFFDREIAKPLGMLDYRNRIATQGSAESAIAEGADGFYQLEAERSRFPAWHFRMSAHDLALYGQLHLDHGRWKGKQIVPADWIDLSTRPYSILNAQYGLAYGMLWDVLVPDAEGDRPSFFHTGLGVHMLGVYPKHRLVMVHRVDTENGSRFNDGDLNSLIRLMHAARLPAKPRMQ
jgi:CubicO group peptidase (beta-lactamase class C family)